MSTTRSLIERSNMGWGSCHLLVTILLFCLVMMMHISNAHAALDPEEENSLKVLRDTIMLPNWTGDPCDAPWITCTNNTGLEGKHVLALNLVGKNLTGNIPPELADFQNLSNINFNTNQLTGPIPDIRNMTNLTILFLADNNFSGGIPASIFQRKTLVEVDIHKNQLNGSIPKSLEKMTQAKYINIRSNLLEGPLPDLSALVKLEQFDASINGLVGPLPDITNLTSLYGLSIAHNLFSGPLPPSIFQHSNLQWLFISNNSLTPGPIPDMSQLTNLMTLNARLCNFQGPIPSMENSKRLQNVELQLNNLTSIPSDFRNLTFLLTMIVHSNRITGNLPDLPAANDQPFFKLAKIDFSNNSFSGEIPQSWADLSFIKEVNVGQNMLQGVIPKEIGNLRSLEKLNLSNNFFSGPIPEEISFLVDLQILDLSNNQLSGMVPESLVKLSKLQSLYLDNNNFTGIPVALATRAGLNISFGDLRIIGNETARSSHSLSSGGTVGVVVGAVFVGISAVIIILLLLRTKRKGKDQLSREDMPKSAQAFSLRQIKAMTQNFKKLIGRGGFGPVYYGKLPDGKEVAVKVRAMDSKQGAKEFLNEVRLLSRLHHRNLVPLVGYCLDAQEQILVYTYMSEGTLHDHLHHLSDSTSFSQTETEALASFTRKPLDWRTRLDIAIKSARGLEYLHKDCNPAVIHRDVKSSNILLTDKLEAKFGDLGISKQATETMDETMNMTGGMTTAIKGTFGYVDPEYFSRQRLTTKSDVYSFGIILLEIITGKRAQSLRFPDSEATTLKEWVEFAMGENKLKSVIDPTMKGGYNEEGMLSVAKTALSCLLPTGAERPEMGEVVHNLTEAHQLEEKLSSEYKKVPDEVDIPVDGQMSIPYNPESPHFSASTFSASSISGSTTAVFSDISTRPSTSTS